MPIGNPRLTYLFSKYLTELYAMSPEIYQTNLKALNDNLCIYIDNLKIKFHQLSKKYTINKQCGGENIRLVYKDANDSITNIPFFNSVISIIQNIIDELNNEESNMNKLIDCVSTNMRNLYMISSTSFSDYKINPSSDAYGYDCLILDIHNSLYKMCVPTIKKIYY
jgi:hypothetical protein